MTSMTPRRRWFAAVHLEPVDRLPFRPKLDGAYAPAQDPPFRDMDIPALPDRIGSDRHVWIGGCTRTVRTRTAPEGTTEDRVRVEHLVPPADVMPPLCKPETIRTVCGWVKSHPIRV